MSAHTPGPWHFTAPTETLHAVRSTNAIVADVGYSRTLEENDANARLIAAAPDLLEALEAGHETLHTPPRGEGPCRCSQCHFVKLRAAALAKVRGAE